MIRRRTPMNSDKNDMLTNEHDYEHEAAQEQTAGGSEAVSPEDMRILEALLFASDEVLTPAKIRSIVPGQPDLRKTRKMVHEINVRLQQERHPFEIVELGGGFQFRTITYYHPWVRQLFKEGGPKKLSLQGLECLAIIAYKQPITKAEIEAIRGVVSDGAMKTLLERRMVTIVGRSDKAGRPLLYGTTPEFLHYFGVKQLADLPRIEEFEALAREKMEELSEEELTVIESLEEGKQTSDNQPETGAGRSESGEDSAGSGDKSGDENAENAGARDTGKSANDQAPESSAAGSDFDDSETAYLADEDVKQAQGQELADAESEDAAPDEEAEARGADGDADRDADAGSETLPPDSADAARNDTANRGADDPEK